MKACAPLVLCVACGDGLVVPDVVTAHGGSRLELQMYRFDDGTEQPESSQMYDDQLHTLCAPQLWADGLVRCVPVADDAVYTDPACTTLVGLAQTIEKPTHFVNTEVVDGQRVPARVFRAGAQSSGISGFFEKWDNNCIGPFPVDAGDPIFEVGDEIDGTTLPVVADSELGGGRLGLEIHVSDGGLLVPFGYVDRDLEAECRITPLPDGSMRCEPIYATTSDAFSDPSCSVPVIVLPSTSQPQLVKIADPVTCTSYHLVGNELFTPVYRRVGDACQRADVLPFDSVFALGDAIDLPQLSRTLELRSDRRLQRIIDDDGELQFFDERLFDTAIGADCVRTKIGDVTYCIPANLAAAFTLFTAGCAIPVPVAEISLHDCVQLAFAAVYTDTSIEVHAIGDRAQGTLYQFTGACTPYVPAADAELHVLGPALDPDTFAASIYYGAR